MLLEHCITGLPVIDAALKPAGVISITAPDERTEATP